MEGRRRDLDERWDEVEDVLRARSLRSMQLVSGDRSLDLNALQSLGLRLTRRLAGIRDGSVQLPGGLPDLCERADLKLGRLLRTIDEYAGGTGEIRSFVWATGVSGRRTAS